MNNILKDIALSLKFILWYNFVSSLFYLVVRFNMIYSNTNTILNYLGILGINLFSFYQAFKHVILTKNIEVNRIKSILLISFIGIEIIMYILLRKKFIDYISIVYTVLVIFFEFFITYRYFIKKYKLYHE